MSKFSEYIGSQFGNPHGIIGAICCFAMNVINNKMYKKVISLIDAADGSKILDVGCGKGRYIKNLLQDAPLLSYYGVDISESVLAYVKSMKVTCGQGTLTSIPYEDNLFAVTYTCEALEHAIDMESSVREMCRVTLPGGKIVIVDKNDGCYGALEIGEWEQWPNEEQLKQIMLSYCSDVQVHHGLRYENMSNEELFTAWIGCVK